MSATAGYVNTDYLLEIAKTLAPLKKRLRELLLLSESSWVLDAGCGPGTDTLALYDICGEKGFVCGIDFDSAMVQAAEHRAQSISKKKPTHIVASNTHIPLKSTLFDACFCDRVLQHIPNAQAVVNEMARITKPGGRIVLIDTDHASLTLSCQCEKTESILRNFRANRLKNGFAAQNLSSYALNAKLTVTAVETFQCITRNQLIFRAGVSADLVEQEAVALGLITQKDLQEYKENLEDLSKHNGFYSIVPMIIVSTIKQ